MCAVAQRFVRDTAIAQDIAQEVIIKYWMSPNRDNVKSVKDYLFTMTKNASLNYLRSKRREELRYEKLSKEEQEFEEAFFSYLVEEEFNQILVNVIDSLTPPYNRVMRYALSGLGNKEIAFLLDISVNTIKFMKATAIRKIREQLPQYVNKE